MPKALTTDWVQVGQSGPTIDGREIEPEWLEQAAGNYDPEGTYTAVMWPEHRRWINYGTIAAVKAERNGDAVGLFAKMKPNGFALDANAQGQKLFSSMELTPNFAETGEFYLSGLALTDSPASLGTSELHFAHQGQETPTLYSLPLDIPLDLSGAAATNTTEESEAPSWFFKAMKHFGFHIPNKAGATPEPEEDTMTDEQMKQFAEIVGNSVGERLDGLKEDLDQRFSALTPGDTADEGSGDVPDDGQRNFSAEVAGALKPVAEKLEELDTKFADLTKRFEQVNPGTQAPESTQPADAGADYL